ncbi:MAG TPA: hypothetical protein VFA74_05895 [Terriglobales bacterium]|nr:hypothetical protein [Terriglobales bacterium]
MSRATVVLFLLAPICFAQSSFSGNFRIRHIKRPGFSLAPTQLHEAEKLYQSVCAVVQRDLPNNALRPRFTVSLGAERDEIHGTSEIWLKKWNPGAFVEGVVVLAVNHRLSADMVQQLTKRAVQYNNAMVSVGDLKEGR